MAEPKYVRTTVSKDGTKLRDEYSDGSFKNVRPNPAYKSNKQEMLDKIVASQAAAPVTATQPKSGVEKRIEKIGSAGPMEAPYSTEQAFDKIGVDRLNMLRKQFNLDSIPYGDPKDSNYRNLVKRAAGEMQAAASQQYPELVKDYMVEKGITPTNRLSSILGPRGYGKKVGKDQYRLTPSDLKKAIEKGDVTDDEILQGYRDDLWHFRGLTLDKKKLSKEEYEKKMQQPYITKGERKFFSDDPTQPYKYTEYETEEGTLPVKDKTITKKDEVVTEGERPDIERNPPTNYQLPGGAPWWLQDIIKTAGAATDLARIKRYQPWQATPQFRLPEATFYDPTRELAANTEQANLAYQAQQAFTNPQQLAAAMATTQGQAAKNAADIMSRYNNLNVGLANQLEGQRTDIMNAASQNKANLDTQLWDKYTIMNQQFDNARAQARQNLRQSYIDAVTNKANTYNLNQLYPQYAVNPMSGGQLYFRPDPNKIKATNKYDKYDELWKKAGTYASDRQSQERLFNIMLKQGSDETDDSDIRAAATRGWQDSSNKE